MYISAGGGWRADDGSIAPEVNMTRDYERLAGRNYEGRQVRSCRVRSCRVGRLRADSHGHR